MINKMKAMSRDPEITQLIQQDRDLAQLMNAREIISSNNNNNCYHSKVNKKIKENKIRMVEIIDFKTAKLHNNSSLEQ